MENKDSILIRKYITLVESIDKKEETKTEEPLNEQLRMFQDLVKTLARTVEVEKALWQTLKTEIPAIGNRFKSASEFKAAAEAGKITSVESAEIVKYAIKNVPEVAIKMKGLLKAQPEFKEIARQVFPNGTQMLPNASKLKLAQETMAKFGVEAKEAEDMLRVAAGGVAKDAKVLATTGKEAVKTAEEISKIKKGKDLLKTGGNSFMTWFKKNLEKFGKGTKPVVENGIKKVSVTKKILQWALLAGGGFLLYAYFTDSDGSDVIITDEDGKKVDPNLMSSFADCLRKLVENKTGEIRETSDGGPVILVKNTGNAEYDSLGGLMFYMTGRVFTGDGDTKRGNWKCKGGKVQPIPESMINEQSDDEISSDVETMISLLDFPVSGDDLKKANALLSKYAKSSRGKDFLELYYDSGYADASLKTSLDYITTFKASSVQAKNNMYKLIKQIESGKTGGGEKQQGGSGTADLSGIDITWDGDKKKEGGDGDKIVPVPQPQKYYQCDAFPFRFGCKNEKIREVQRCIGMESKYQTGNFGPLTLSQMRNKFGMDVIDEITYNGIISKCKGSTPQPQSGSTSTTGTTVTPTKTAEPTKTTEPTNVEPAKVASATKSTKLNREGCKTLFKTIDERDQSQGGKTATNTEIEQLRFCLQQYNFGVGTGANKIKNRYGLTPSGGDRGIRR